MYLKSPCYLFASLLLLLTTSVANADTLKIIVTIKPIHSLVSNLTHGITTPQLLIDGLQSPHDYTLKPSERRSISQADLVIYTSAQIEGFIEKLKDSDNNQGFIELITIPGIHTLESRSLHGHDHDPADQHTLDGHIWLSVNNAKAITNYLFEQLSQKDNNNVAIYSANRDRLLKKLDRLQKTIMNKLTPISNKAFIQFHDAFQYFEDEFGLTSSLYVTSSPEHQSGIRQLRNLKQQIKEQNIRCVFYEPPHIPGILRSLTENTNARTLPLEPVGSQLAAGEDLYFNLINNIANQLEECLGRPQ